MANMSYCRFENTVSDLKDCYDNMDTTDTSPEENKARKRLFRLCKQICEEFEYEDFE